LPKPLSSGGQQDYRSRFLAVLNAGQETYDGISYTQL